MSASEMAEEFRKSLRSAEEMARSFAWIQGKSGLPWLSLDLDIPYGEMLAEAKSVRKLFVSHRSSGEPGYREGNHGWKAIALHGISPTHTQSGGVYGYRQESEVPYHWTEIADMAPVTTRFFKEEFPCDEYQRVRYVILEPGGYIYPHIDRDAPFLDEVNIALNHPENCYFKMEGAGYVPFRPRSAFVLDVSRTHAVVNFSDEDRYHMIVHGVKHRNKRWQQLVERSYKKFLNG